MNSGKRYNGSCRLIEFDQGGDKNDSGFSVKISYRQIADALYESIARYLLKSDFIPGDFYFDTIVNGNAKRIWLYRKDKDDKLNVKSLYELDSSGNLMLIKL